MFNYLVETIICLCILPLFGFCVHCLLVGVMAILSSVLSNKFVGWLVNRAMFLGVVQHELAHAALGVVSGAKINKIVFFHPEGNRLGYVEYAARGGKIRQSIQHCLIAVAPILVGFISLLISYYCMIKYNLQSNIILWYYMISVFAHMNMSSVDLKNYLKGIPFVFIICFIICFILGEYFNLCFINFGG